ncbi:MAG: DUF2202 domain-containing protein [Flavobacteriales bacterium]|nr:DUF2202 domain-containing protein [Flavobacteriales bacterium]
MRTRKQIAKGMMAFVVLAGTLSACSKEENTGPTTAVAGLSESDKGMLLFMLEEEKLARDTYRAMDALWGTMQFTNIQNSEQAHMDRIAGLLDAYGVAYTILPEGQFADQALQDLYDQFMIDGAQDEAAALQIGATIEDLDIVDLQDRMDETATTSIDDAFAALQCGSRNHLRAFVGAIENGGGTYVPQFLTQAAYDAILAGAHENCN